MSSFSIQSRASPSSKDKKRREKRTVWGFRWMWNTFSWKVLCSDGSHKFMITGIRVSLPFPQGAVMWIQPCSFQRESLPCYVRISNHTVRLPKYIMRISSSASLSCVSSSFSVPAPIMFHNAWQSWPASCQSPAPKSFKQSTSLGVRTHTHTRTNTSCDSRERDSHDWRDCGY